MEATRMIYMHCDLSFETSTVTLQRRIIANTSGLKPTAQNAIRFNTCSN
jgi:hypothetical protein